MSEHKSKELKASFSLPDFFSLAALNRWSAAVEAHKEELKDTLSEAHFKAIYLGLAVEAKLVTNWQSETMPDPAPSDPELVDVRVVLWAGEICARFVIEGQRVPKN
ncbi:MAG TPA: hypothetical protein PKD55_05835 [Bellilinea sp.]|nr:hypothetical protein [Bellilinea sp.]